MKTKTNGLWRKYLAILVLTGIILGCASVLGNKPRNKIEVWLIDPEEAALFRVTVDNKEKYIPIKGSKIMNKFVCTHTDDFYLLMVGYGEADYD